MAEYSGEVLGDAEAGARMAAADVRALGTYLLTLREHTAAGLICTHIDARRIGGVARFCNHSCLPNLHVVATRVDARAPIAALRALRDILPGEELTFSYGGGIARGSARAARCECGQQGCTRKLPFDP